MSLYPIDDPRDPRARDYTEDPSAALPSDDIETAIDAAVRTVEHYELPTDVVVREDCPPDRLFLVDPAAVGHEGEAERVIVCPTDDVAEQVREALP